MTAKIQIRHPESRTVTLSSLCLGDFFSFTSNDERAYVVVAWDGDMQEMQYREIGTDREFTASSAAVHVNKLRLTAAFFELDV